jgi:hypothetical protein
MTIAGLLPSGISVADLFRASERSLDPATAAFPLTRIFPITIYVDADEDAGVDVADIGRQIKDEAIRLLGEAGYEVLEVEWGPFSGSHVITIFGRTSEQELGSALFDRLRQVSRRLAEFADHIPAAIKICLAVGTFAIVIVGHDKVATAFDLPIQAIVLVEAVEPSIAIAESIGKLFLKNQAKKGIAPLPRKFKL